MKEQVGRKFSFSGPFGYTQQRAASVDFTAPIGQGLTTLVVPLLLESEIWAVSHPLADEVWYALLIIMPIYFIVMGLADYVVFGQVMWQKLSEFVIRNALSQHAEMPNIKRTYQNIFIIIWVTSIFIVVQCYAGNLTAMLTAPGLPDPIKNATEFLEQDKIPLVMRKGSIAQYYFKFVYSVNRTEGKLGNIASVSDEPLTPTEYLKYGCYSTEQYSDGRNAAVCNDGEFWGLISYDYSRTGQCNFYVIKDKFLRTHNDLGAFQV